MSKVLLLRHTDKKVMFLPRFFVILSVCQLSGLLENLQLVIFTKLLHASNGTCSGNNELILDDVHPYQ